MALPSDGFEHPVIKSLFETTDDERLCAVHCPTIDRDTNTTNPLKMLYNEFLCRRFYKHAVAEAQLLYSIDLILIGMFDDAAIHSGLIRLDFGNIPWLGIVMRQSFHFTAMGAIGPPETSLLSVKRRLFFRLLRLIKGQACILTIDKSLLQYVSTVDSSCTGSIAYLPDPVDNRGERLKPDLRQQMGIPDDAVAILAYGTLREGKGVKLLIDAMHHLPKHVHVMLVGLQHEITSDYVNHEKNSSLLESGRLHQVNRYIDVSEDPDFFGAADIIWLGYRNYYSMSAVMVQAAQYERPSIAAKTGLVGWMTDHYKTGTVVDTTRLDDVLRGFDELLSGKISPDTEHYWAMANAHDMDAFETALMQAFSRVMRKNESAADRTQTQTT